MSLPYPDQRLSTLVNWLQNTVFLDIQRLEKASSDASFRRYFRVVHQAGCHIVMDAPPEKENIEPFIRIAELFRTARLHVPAIHAINIEHGFVLLEDFGSISLLDTLQADNADQLYRQALDSLFELQTGIDIYACRLPAYDTALLERELGIFEEWFLEKQLGLILPVALRTPLHQLLIDSALEQPQVCVHRDFHSRNLMVLDRDSPGIIDFQDAVTGPISYDPVSLLRDCYICWPDTRVEQWAHQYYQRLFAAGLLSVEFIRFKRWFDLMGLQRHLKAAGIFSRLHLRDGKSAYLADIPRTLGYIGQVCQTYPELKAFNHFLQRRVLPVYRTTL
ncbi:MAG: phosphotransferase [Methylococcales bacterium]|nr:phosphotransferase [Methylococcales bacterium]